MKKLFCVVAAASLLYGCVSVGHQLDQAKVEQIKKGVTTREQVLQLVGKPDQMTRDGDGIVTFQYVYVHASATAASYIPLAGPFVGGANTRTEMLSVTFGTNDVVSSLVNSTGGNQMNMGQ